MLVQKHSFPDEHTTIIFILYYMNKKVLVWRTKFMVVYTVLGQGIYLRTIENFLVALDSVFQLFNIARDVLWQLYTLKQLSRLVDKYVFEFRVFAI